MTNIRRALEAAAAGGDDTVTYVEDVFSTYVYAGTGATLAINNGIDLDGEGGMVWIKMRDDTYGHRLFDTERGVLEVLESYDVTAEATLADSLTVFNSNGFTVGSSGDTNLLNSEMVGWTFRKAPGFFDVVTYTGNGSAQAISHSLGSTPGCIMIKNLDSSTNWETYHRKLNGGTTPQNYKLELNETAAESANSNVWNDTAPTSTHFTVGTNNSANLANYVAYLFAHDDQIFGADGDESIIKCGGFTTTATWGNYKVDLGWEPQYVLMKRADSSSPGDWFIFDSMRGIIGPGDSTLADTSAFNTLYATSDDAELQANTAAAETTQGRICLYSQGFIGTIGFGNADFIYIAIRRPMKVPEAGTEVFAVDSRTSGNPNWTSNFVVDGMWEGEDVSADRAISVYTRLTGLKYNNTYRNNASSTGGSDFANDFMTGWRQDGSTVSTAISWMFRRAPGFMDIVVQVGDGVGGASWNHGLGVVPEMIIGKNRTDAVDWAVYHHGVNGGVDPADYQLQLNDDAAQYDYNGYWDDVLPTTTHFTTGGSQNTNGTGKEYTFYLFTTLAGVSKVGSYTADATLTTINCGFAAGARFILIKRVDATGDWYLYDSLRGIVAGNDPYLILNTETAEVTGTDYIDPDNSGFQITTAGSSTINVNTGEYIFLAIA
jgi:hypothetical protein